MVALARASSEYTTGDAPQPGMHLPPNVRTWNTYPQIHGSAASPAQAHTALLLRGFIHGYKKPAWHRGELIARGQPWPNT